jgi:16S rRNA (adenine1518-N6/adenine1519-N6)-dimethyltransferase
VCGDVLENWQEAGLMAEPYDLIANLPYYIATNIILRGLADPQCKTMLVMVQEEVAEKFSAQEGEKAFNSLSVLAQNVAKVSIVVRVPPTAFEPAPKINSAVLLIEKHADHTDKELETFLAYAFKQPRKTLLKNLSVCCDKTLLKEHFSTLGIDEKIRPHQLSLASYHQLYDIYRSLDGRTKQ